MCARSSKDSVRYSRTSSIVGRTFYKNSVSRCLFVLVALSRLYYRSIRVYHKMCSCHSTRTTSPRDMSLFERLLSLCGQCHRKPVSRTFRFIRSWSETIHSTPESTPLGTIPRSERQFSNTISQQGAKHREKFQRPWSKIKSIVRDTTMVLAPITLSRPSQFQEYLTPFTLSPFAYRRFPYDACLSIRLY